jgi:hypothetical protein
LSQSTTDTHADIPIPTADDWDNITEKYFADPSGTWGPNRKDGPVYKCTNGYVIPPNKVIPAWEDREAVVFWRGMGTGCGNTSDTNPRLKLSNITIPGLDAGIIRYTRRDKINPETGVVEFSTLEAGIKLKDKVERFDQLKYKFMLNVEGNSAAYRFGSLFRLGFCVINVESKYKLWFEPFLKDRVHFIQVKHDLSNLAETVEWCLTHDAECKQIAENGRRFYDKYFTREFVYNYMADVLNAASASVKYKGGPGKQEYGFVPYDRIKDIAKYVRTKLYPFNQKVNNLRQYRLVDSQKSAILAQNFTERYIIIVPYRDNALQDRKGQLERFIKHYAGSQILVVEQTDTHKFNRGALLNAGYHFLNSLESMDIDVGVKQSLQRVKKFVFHDVDLLLPHAISDVYYGDDSKGKDIIHMGHLIDNYYDYPDFLGGIIAFSKEAFESINGFPNHMYGWGGEDDALKIRIVSNSLTVYRPDEKKEGTEMTLPVAKDTKNVKSMIDQHKNEDLILDEHIWRMNGINSVQYKLKAHGRIASLVYRITVEL